MSLHLAGVAIAALVVLITMAARKRLKTEQGKHKFRQQFEGKHHTEILLLKKDIAMINGNPIATLTVIRGDSFPVNALKNKVREMLQKNLWLCCRILTDKTHKYVATCPIEYNESLLDDHFSVDMNRSIDPKLDQYALVKELADVLVKPGVQAIDTDTPRFRITICKSPGGFAICVSLCHVIADGATFYRLYGMLSESAEVLSLVPSRVMAFEEEVTKNLIISKLPRSPLAMMNAIKLRVFGPRFRFKTYVVDEQWVVRRKADLSKEEKEKGSSSSTSSSPASANCEPPAPFVSTNDILTSWISDITGASFTGMAVNFRNRMLGITSDHVGNYEELVLYRRADCVHPLQIRRSLFTFKSESNTFLTAWEQWEWNGVMLTNWAGLYEEVQFEGCEHVCHMPVMSGLPPFRHVAIIYRPREGETAVLVASRSPRVFSLIGEANSLGISPLREEREHDEVQKYESKGY
jgi:hypothetical protein